MPPSAKDVLKAHVKRGINCTCMKVHMEHASSEPLSHFLGILCQGHAEGVPKVRRMASSEMECGRGDRRRRKMEGITCVESAGEKRHKRRGMPPRSGSEPLESLSWDFNIPCIPIRHQMVKYMPITKRKGKNEGKRGGAKSHNNEAVDKVLKPPHPSVGGDDPIVQAFIPVGSNTPKESIVPAEFIPRE
ncbi:hypothetical protein Nepgr_021817 [Nepenthes gracilis]|uniref:Uncharacterized protein n=1 Tax=Nepenthes gracilis TaxID=150966 RepID=A0AAD3SZP5_NEPGR|nr:hypothetical protein Nepgr_021817 [Nepenthes gracilis]